MKKILTLTLFLLGTVLGYSQAGTFTLCSADNSTPCGCTAACNPSICSPTAGGNCPRSPGTLTIAVPVNTDATVSVANQGCGSTSGLDSGDSYSVNGTVLNGSSNTTPPFNGCFSTTSSTGEIAIILDANRVDECLTITVTFAANGGTADPTCDALGPLPVEFGYFSVAANRNEEVNINWMTVSEDNSAYFLVEHSRDGRQFESIASLDGTGFSVVPQEYNYTHRNISAGTHYYRLNQVDMNGQESYSEIEVVKIDRDQSTLLSPTVVQNAVRIELEDASALNSEIMIFDMNGRMLIKDQLLAGDYTKELEVGDLPTGSYFVRMQLDQEMISARFIKL